jgi:hypothetical protein
MTRILDPTLGPSVAPPPVTVSRAPRPAALRGATIGLLANGKSNGMVLLDAIADRLRERHGVADVMRVAKTNASAPVSEEDAALLAKHCTAVVTAIGD